MLVDGCRLDLSRKGKSFANPVLSLFFFVTLVTPGRWCCVVLTLQLLHLCLYTRCSRGGRLPRIPQPFSGCGALSIGVPDLFPQPRASYGPQCQFGSHDAKDVPPMVPHGIGSFISPFSPVFHSSMASGMSPKPCSSFGFQTMFQEWPFGSNLDLRPQRLPWYVSVQTKFLTWFLILRLRLHVASSDIGDQLFFLRVLPWFCSAA